MTPPRGRIPALAVVLLLLAIVGGGAAGAAPASAAVPPATVSIDTLDPAVGTPGERLHVAGTVRVGAERLRDVTVHLRLSRSPVNSRSELAGVAEGRTTGKDGPAVASQSVPGTVQAGETFGFDLGAELGSIAALDQFGVYVVGVDVSATQRGGSGSVAIVRTFLPWLPSKQTFEPTGFTWLWPLVAQPTRLADGTFASDALANQMTPGGRLSRLTDTGHQLGQEVPLTWVVDPDLLDSARAMSGPDGYTILRKGRETVGDGGPGVGAWLDGLRTATATSAVVGLPYADPDLSALRRGRLTADVARSRDIGAQVATDVLGREVTSDVVWPADGFVDRPTLTLLRRSGVQVVVLDGQAQPTRLELNYTPSGRSSTSTGGGSLTTLVADSGLTTLLAGAGHQPLLAAQRFLAETAMITAELPSSGGDRVILVAPPRRWNPPLAFLDRLVAGVGQASWISGTGLDGMRTSPPGEVERRAVRYPTEERRRELSKPYLTALQTQHSSIALFSAVLTAPDQLVPDLDKAVLRLESTWWRGREDRVNRLSAETTNVAEQLGSIHVQPGSYTFGSKSGTIPLTIANGVAQEVVVYLRLEPQQPRLRLEATKPITIGPNRKVQVPVKASAVAGGTVIINATLHTRGGSALSPQPVQLRIRITQYGTVALAITGAAAGVLVLMALARLVRRAVAARRASAQRETP